jgi:hypothetical protein
MKKDQQIQELATLLSVSLFVYFFKESLGRRRKRGECRGGEQPGIGHVLESLS